MNVLVTGATGLVGSHIVRALLDERHVVNVLVRPNSNRSAIDGLPVHTHLGDVLEPGSLADAVIGSEVVFHAAAYFDYWRTSGQLDETAVVGTCNVLTAAAAAGVSRVVLTSSSVVGGYSIGPDGLSEAEAGAYAPDEPAYVLSKVKQEREALGVARDLNLALVVARPTMTVGPFSTRLGPSNAVIATYLKDPFKMTYPGGCNIVGARDVGRGHVLLAARGVPYEAYNLGGENLTWEQLHRLIAELTGVGGPHVKANHTLCVAAAALHELCALAFQDTPVTTRAQAKWSAATTGTRARRPLPLGTLRGPRVKRSRLQSAGWRRALTYPARCASACA